MAESAQQRLQLEAHREVRRWFEQLGSRVGVTDGANKENLREWIRGIDNAVVWTGTPDPLVLLMVGYLTSGSLAILLREQVSPQGDGNRTWANCNALIVANFLNEYLCSRVESLVQNAYEDVREYGRCFKAYARQEVAVPLVMERLVKLFVNSLRDKTVRTQVHLLHPNNLEAAFASAQNASRAISKAECSSRVGEPMEIAAVPTLPTPNKTAEPRPRDDTQQILKTLQGEVKSLRHHINLFQARSGPTRGSGRGNRPRGGTRRAPSTNSRGEPRCYNCNAYGHLARQCSKQSVMIAAWELQKTKQGAGSTCVCGNTSRWPMDMHTSGFRRQPIINEYEYIICIICKKTHRMPLLRRGLALRSLTSHVIPTKGKAMINVYGRNVEFHIVDKMQHNLLLGHGALHELQSRIDYEYKTIELAGLYHTFYEAVYRDHQILAMYNELGTWMQEFHHLFLAEGQATGKADVVCMHIDTGDYPPIRQRPYHIPMTKRLVVEKEIDKMLEVGVVELRASPWASPITLVTKKDGGIRFCIDFRKSNSVNEKDAHP